MSKQYCQLCHMDGGAHRSDCKDLAASIRDNGSVQRYYIADNRLTRCIDGPLMLYDVHAAKMDEAREEIRKQLQLALDIASERDSAIGRYADMMREVEEVRAKLAKAEAECEGMASDHRECCREIEALEDSLAKERAAGEGMRAELDAIKRDRTWTKADQAREDLLHVYYMDKNDTPPTSTTPDAKETK